MMIPRIVTPLMAVGAVLLLGACGSDATAPQSGHASAKVMDDPGSTSPSATLVHVRTMAPSASRGALTQSVSGSSAFSGSMTSTMQVAISADGQSWVDLGAPANSVVQLQSTGETTTVASQATVPVGTYAYVRLVLQGASAQVSGTLGGILYTNAQILVGSSGSVVIEKQVQPFTITASTSATVIFDVNSEMWITAQSAQSQTAATAELEAATTAAIE